MYFGTVFAHFRYVFILKLHTNTRRILGFGWRILDMCLLIFAMDFVLRSGIFTPESGNSLCKPLDFLFSQSSTRLWIIPYFDILNRVWYFFFFVFVFLFLIFVHQISTRILFAKFWPWFIQNEVPAMPYSDSSRETI